MDTVTTQRNNAKATLLEALATHRGDTKNSEVIKAIGNLTALNPTKAPTQAGKLLEGNWLLINAPTFPNRLPDDRGRYVYTLGRLAFNMFEPVDLKVAIERVLQPIFAVGENNRRTYNIVVEFKTIGDRIPELQGIVKNLAVCTPIDPNTLQVEFTGGELIPQPTQDPEKHQQWLTVFGNTQVKHSLNIVERIKSLIVKWMFGIEKASEIDFQTGKKDFVMNKSPKGKLQVLYLDEELRITKGNKETVLVCQRQEN